MLLIASHPEWVRGLKLLKPFKEIAIHRVAPRVGAWIETYMENYFNAMDSVAPRVGAWIETGLYAVHSRPS